VEGRTGNKPKDARAEEMSGTGRNAKGAMMHGAYDALRRGGDKKKTGTRAQPESDEMTPYLSKSGVKGDVKRRH